MSDFLIDEVERGLKEGDSIYKSIRESFSNGDYAVADMMLYRLRHKLEDTNHKLWLITHSNGEGG